MKKKLERFAKLIGITPDAFITAAINDDESFCAQVIMLFKEDPKIFRSFLFAIFDLRVRSVLNLKYDKKVGKISESIKSIFNQHKLHFYLEELEHETGLIFPKAVISNLSFHVQTALLVVPFLAVVYFLFLNPMFLIVVYGVVKIGAGIVVIIVPYAIAYLLFPTFFQPNRLFKISTYEDLINDLVWTYQFEFSDNDFVLTKEELKKIFNSL
jgi:hypothetical protein